MVTALLIGIATVINELREPVYFSSLFPLFCALYSFAQLFCYLILKPRHLFVFFCDFPVGIEESLPDPIR